VPIDLSKFATIAIVAFLAPVLMCTWNAQSFSQDLADQPSIQQPAVQQATLQQSTLQQSTLQQSTLQQSTIQQSTIQQPSLQQPSLQQPVAENAQSDWLSKIEVGYDDGFVIASQEIVELKSDDDPFSMKINGWGQLRFTEFESATPLRRDQKQFQLQRGRLVFSGSAFTSDFKYFLQLDGRSSSGDDIRLLDYYLQYDVGHHSFGLQRDTISFKTGKYKMPFNLSRYLTAREFELTDRSVASTYFDVNRSLSWGLGGQFNRDRTPIFWEAAIFNGLVTGGAETGSSGDLDNNFAYSTRLYCYPRGEWGRGELADFDCHQKLATRMGFGFATTANNRIGATEFNSSRVVDSGDLLSSLLPPTATQYEVSLYAVDASLKYRGWSSTMEYYFRNISDIEGATLPDLYDHGFWFQIAKFIVPEKFQITSRWSRVVGNSGTLGGANQSTDEIAGGMVYYFRGQNAKVTLDATYLNGSPISSQALDVTPGDTGWLVRTQVQFAF